MPYIKEKDFLFQTIKEACDIYLTNGFTNIQHKDAYDLVTDVDYKIETFIKQKINETFPLDDVVGEEFSPNLLTENTKRWWCIDPIDGTVNFAHHFPLYGIQVCLVEGNEPVLAMIVLPQLNDVFYAIRNHGAYHNNVKINMSKKDISLSDAIIFCGDLSHKDETKRITQLKIIERLSNQVARIKMVGAACVDYTSVACGRGDGLISITKNVWDILPGILICRESGILVTNLEGQPHKIGDSGVIAASNPTILQALLNTFR